ncbi:MAG: PilZ domain-containing protein [Lachnospiraceae bacterium]|nr:PilZ domain-containing protein [Lachnospiraceae bacterium]
MHEKRKSRRLDIDVKIKLNQVKNLKKVDDINKDKINVTLVNISRDGLAFKSYEELKLNTFYDVNIVLWTKENFKSVIEIVRMESIDDDNEILYGCRFIGIRPADQLKIQIYEILNDSE